MRLGTWWINGIVVMGAMWMFVQGTQTGALGLLPKPNANTQDVAPSAVLAQMESDAVRAPSAGNVAKLAHAYLDRGHPGLAAAAIARAPEEVRASPEVAHAEARALLLRGKAAEALAVARDAEGKCEDGACPAWLVARTSRQVAFLKELTAAGVEDPEVDPEATRAAYDKSLRSVRLVAMR